MSVMAHGEDQTRAVVQALAQALHPLPQCALVLDLQGVILTANPAYLATLETAADLVIGQPVERFWRLDDPLMRAGFSQDWEGPISALSKTGEFLNFKARQRVIRDPQGNPLTVLCLFEPAQALRAADGSPEQRLVVTQKMASVSTLAGGISHEFNNLLTGILGYTELLAGRLGSDPVARDYADQIRRAAAEASELTRQLGVFSQSALLDLQEVNLHDVLTAAVRVVSPGVLPQVRFLDRSSAAPATTRGDSAHLQQAIIALLLNACEAMPHGGAVTTEIENVTLDTRLAHAVGLGEAGQFVRLTIIDEGAGMDATTQRRASEPFFSTKDRPHTGLGLSAAFGIVQKHRGTIQLDSTPGRGTAVRVFLPASQVSSREGGPMIPTLDEPATVLLVEDEEIPRKLQAHVLQSAGYAVLAAVDGQQGLDLFREYGTEIQLVITDIMMPRMTGDIMVSELRKLGPPVRVMAISGYSRGEAVDRLRALGVDAFVQKPFTGQGLLEHVRQVLNAPASQS